MPPCLSRPVLHSCRSFLGEQGFHTPLHGLAAEHVSLARALLLQVDLVLDLDAGNDATDWTMEQTLGWRLGMSKVGISRSRKECHDSSKPSDLGPLSGHL